MHQRTLSLIGEEALARLRAGSVLVVGVGGVGGYVCEALARCGIGKLTLVDGDVVEESNKNRQIVALNSTLGQYKTDVMAARIADIDTEIEVTAVCANFNRESADNIFCRRYDYVVDAIDSVADKIELVARANKEGVPIVSAMGAGNRYEACNFGVSDIFETSGDGLAKAMRKGLRERGITALDVCWTTTPPQKNPKGVGSICYVPAVCGMTIAAHVAGAVAGL